MKIILTEEQIKNRVCEIAQELNDFYKGEEVTAICTLKGSFIFTADLVRHLDMPLKTEFIRLSSYGSSTETSGKVNAVDIKLPDLNGKNVLIIEDIVDSGLTAKFLTDFINNNFQVKDLKFCSLLNKKIKRRVEFEPDLYGFEVGDEFVAGYGLDFDGYYRNLPYVIEKE